MISLQAKVTESNQQKPRNVFFKILDEKEDFGECLQEIKKAFFPEDKYLKQAQAKEGLTNVGMEKPEDRVEEIQETFKKIVKNISDEHDLPFLQHFHQLFLKRQWNIPYNTPKQNAKNLVRLVRLEASDEALQNDLGYNYSAYQGAYNHFVNVVAALARLIMYFKKESNVEELVKKMRSQSDALLSNQVDSQQQTNIQDPLVQNLIYGKDPDLRQFKLMLAGFYHDIGKTIQNPRHAMEGAIILEFDTTKSRYKLHRIVKDVNSNWKFDRDDLLFISDLVLYHDQYGTLSTGEDGYLQLVDVIDCIHRYSLKEEQPSLEEQSSLKEKQSSNPQKRLEFSRRYIFDLWLLNVADIMVSIQDKEKRQRHWEKQDSAEEEIKKFLFSNEQKDKSNCLLHDLEISLELLEKYCCQRHLDDLTDLKNEAHKLSLQHVVERLRRLMVSTLRKQVKDDGYIEKGNEKEGIANFIYTLSDEEWNSTIVGAIEAIANREEFSRRFSWIKKSDYALGFFQKLAKQALTKIAKSNITGWTYNGNGNFDRDYLNKTQAQYITDNYVTTVIQILGHLLFREPSLDSPRNVEFSDASNRLTEDKINKLLSFEGPSRTRKSIALILQTIYVY